MEAQCLSHFGDVRGTVIALKEAENSARSSGPELQTGIFGFPAAKLHYYAGSSLTFLQKPQEANSGAKESKIAIDLFAHDGRAEESHPDRALARIYLATAHFEQGNIDGMLPVLGPILAIPPRYRISWHFSYLRRLSGLVASGKSKDSEIARELSETVNAFCSNDILVTLPRHDLSEP